MSVPHATGLGVSRVPQPCAVCAWADRTGSWVDCPGQKGLTHCRRCHGSWSRRGELQHCASCCRTFASWRAADRHHRGSECLDPVAVLDKRERPVLALSERRRDDRTTVEVWALASHDPLPVEQIRAFGERRTQRDPGTQDGPPPEDH